jgi:hypothetical protein
MILDGLEGDPSAGCDAAGWFLCCGPWKIKLASWQDLTSLLHFEVGSYKLHVKKYLTL